MWGASEAYRCPGLAQSLRAPKAQGPFGSPRYKPGPASWDTPGDRVRISRPHFLLSRPQPATLHLQSHPRPEGLFPVLTRVLLLTLISSRSGPAGLGEQLAPIIRTITLPVSFWKAVLSNPHLTPLSNDTWPQSTGQGVFRCFFLCWRTDSGVDDFSPSQTGKILLSGENKILKCPEKPKTR